jgi:hypothetical protein
MQYLSAHKKPKLIADPVYSLMYFDVSEGWHTTPTLIANKMKGLKNMSENMRPEWWKERAQKDEQSKILIPRFTER